MSGIHWLHRRSLMEQQTSELTLLAEVIALARSRVRDVGNRIPGNVPESFKVV